MHIVFATQKYYLKILSLTLLHRDLPFPRPFCYSFLITLSVTIIVNKLYIFNLFTIISIFLLYLIFTFPSCFAASWPLLILLSPDTFIPRVFKRTHVLMLSQNISLDFLGPYTQLPYSTFR